MPLDVYDHTKHRWSLAAERWLRKALAEVIDGGDALIYADGAKACLEIEAGIREPDMALIEEAPEDDDA